jgi:predicted ATPase with chaperone activity
VRFPPWLAAGTHINDLTGSETITAPHVAEALQYRARGEAG